MLFALPAKTGEENHLFSEQKQAQMADLPYIFSEVTDDNMTHLQLSSQLSPVSPHPYCYPLIKHSSFSRPFTFVSHWGKAQQHGL